MSELRSFLIRVIDLLPAPFGRLARRVFPILRNAFSVLRRRDPGVLLVFPGVSALVKRLFVIRSPGLRRGAQPGPSASKAPHRPEFSITYSSKGNDFFIPIAQSLSEAFEKAGFKAELAADAATPGSIPVIVAPHEFFTLAAPTELHPRVDLKRAILLNTEQPHTKWLGTAQRNLREVGVEVTES